MPLASCVRASFVRHFATPASRFRVAVVTGFLVSTVGFTTVVVSDRDSVAQSVWGAIFDQVQPVPAAPSAAAPSSGLRSWLAPQHGRREASRRRVAKIEPARVMRAVEHEVRRYGHEAHYSEHEAHYSEHEARRYEHEARRSDHEARRSDHEARYSESRPMELGRKSVCVRLCDGFAFPVGAYHGSEDRASHEATCHAECPGAATALYVVPAGSDSIEDAVRVGSDKNYSEMPYAFHYTSTLSQACTCHPVEGNRVKSLLHDFTLRRGDAVMTPKGFKIFHGGGHFPYRRSDFLTLAQSRDVKKGDRAAFHAIERASLISSPNIVAQAVTNGPWKPQPAPVSATKGLEHQASLSQPAPPRQP